MGEKSEVVEEVARAMQDASPDFHRWEELDDVRREIWRNIARAGMKRLRVPSQAMAKEGSLEPVGHQWGPGGEYIDEQSAADVWTRMMDEALK